MGQFTTITADKKPGRTYLVKVEGGSKGILKDLLRSEGKTVQVSGKLRVIDSNGEAKYLVVISVMEASPTPPVAERRKQGGL